ncbi:MAG: endopeptidase La [Bacilli bacterium]|nr:endopeptidase La [Bacilli bacterium]
MVETNLPVMFLKDQILLPYNELRLEFTSETDKLILNTSESYHDSYLLLVNLSDPLEVNPTLRELPKVAILGKIKSKIELPNGIVRVVLVGIDRVEVLNYVENENNNFEAFVIPTKEYDYDSSEALALKRILLRNLELYIELSSYMSNNVMGRIEGINNLSRITDIIVDELPIDYSNKLKYVTMINPMNRVRAIIETLNKEIETIRLENTLEDELKVRLEQSQKDYVLKEKLKLIKEELGEFDLKDDDVVKLKENLDKMVIPNNIRKRLEDEIKRYEMTPSSSPELTVVRNYIDWLMNLPWYKNTKDNYNLEKIEESLNESHYGLFKVKERILEYIAVSKNTKNKVSPIICFVGPPGVGKTSLAKSIAKALNKKFVNISVGGMNDDSEIVGHRRTYIGSNPGKIIQAMKKAGTNNPVFLIDEIDKLTKDYRSDPASCLLDVLDREQNSMFVDNYIEEEYDLSKVMFILTANNSNDIPEALRDRLEIINLPSYTLIEKLNIAKTHLIPKLLKEYDLKNVTITDEAINKIITNYTKESGARELNRLLSSVLRKIIVDKLKNKKDKYVIEVDDVEKYLGIEKYVTSKNNKITSTGVINALAYTPYGGEILRVSSTCYKGDKDIIVTGLLGESMKESVSVALSYIKTNYKLFNIDYKMFDNDFHIHFESGSIPKDGPSAGVTIITSILSTLTDKVIDSKISMTGEVTLRGDILPIGGLKEKLIAASQNNINIVFIPKDNIKDLEDIDVELQEKIKIIPVSNYMEIYKKIF